MDVAYVHANGQGAMAQDMQWRAHLAAACDGVRRPGHGQMWACGQAHAESWARGQARAAGRQMRIVEAGQAAKAQ